MTIRAELDNMRGRVEGLDVGRDDYTKNMVTLARTDLPRLLDAVERVLELHQPIDVLGDQSCAECLEYDPSCPSGPAPWPCETVTAINDALEGK